jgi:alkanesulfonate monooxygenase SsuD/methylene tetrahydromethanopterin reductase-like flavin-dependent oxidoreductase (luciferase family)
LSGRDDLVCGLGLGNPVRVLKPLGVRPAGAPRQLAAAVEIIKRLLRGEEVTITAAESDFKLHSVQLDIDPLPSARIFIGTRGPRTLEKAGSVADGVFVESLFTPEGIGWARNLLNSGAQAASGGQFDRPYIAWQLVEVLSENPTTMSESARNFAAMLMSTTATTTLRTLGIGDATIAMVKMPSFSPRDVPEVDLRKFVASGDPDDLSSRVAAAEAAGASGWCSVFVGAQDRAVSMAKRFAQVIESYN